MNEDSGGRIHVARSKTDQENRDALKIGKIRGLRPWGRILPGLDLHTSAGLRFLTVAPYAEGNGEVMVNFSLFPEAFVVANAGAY